jgi:hypothetical protein
MFQSVRPVYILKEFDCGITSAGVLHESEVGSTPLVVAPAVLALIRVGTKARRGSSETQSIGVADV